MFKNSDKEIIAKECLNQQSKVVCDFYSRGRTIQGEDQVKKIHSVLGNLGIKGKVEFKTPQIRYQLFEQHEWYQGHHEVPYQKTMKSVYFGIQLSCNKIATSKFNSRFELNKRIYLGPTTADNDLAFLMCNQALVRQGTVVLDPFAGTGGLLIPPASKGAIVFGCDLDIRVLNGYSVGRINKRSPFYTNEKKYEIFTPKINLNFEQYELPYPNIIRIDSTKLTLRDGQFFDAIIADPPYGIRAMSRSVAGKKLEEPQKIEEERKEEEKIQKKEEKNNEEKQEQTQFEEKVLENERILQEKKLKKQESSQITTQIISQQQMRKKEKRKILRENKKKRKEMLPEQQKQFQKDLLTRLNKERVDQWDKFDKGKIETTERQKIFAGLLGVARKYLLSKGRLVFLYPVYEDEQYLKANSLPTHEGFTLIDLSQNKMSKGNSRILVTMQKQ